MASPKAASGARPRGVRLWDDTVPRAASEKGRISGARGVEAIDREPDAVAVGVADVEGVGRAVVDGYAGLLQPRLPNRQVVHREDEDVARSGLRARALESALEHEDAVSCAHPHGPRAAVRCEAAELGQAQQARIELGRPGAIGDAQSDVVDAHPISAPLEAGPL